MSGFALNIQPYTPVDYVRSVQRQTHKFREALANDASPRNKVTKFPLPADESRSIALADAPTIVEQTGQSVALVPPETLSRPKIIKSNCSFAKPEVPSQESDDDDDDDEQLNFTDSESVPMSESEDEKNDVPSPDNMNDLVYKETMIHHISTSPASTIRTVPSTSLVLPLGSEVDEYVITPTQRSPSPTSPTTSPRQRPRDKLHVSRRSLGTTATERGKHFHGQTEDASEPPSSQCGKHEPVSPGELPRRTQPHRNVSQNDSACINSIGKATDDDDRHSYSDNSSDNSSDNEGGNEGGNEGDDDEYVDDGSCSDSGGEDDDYNRQRMTDCSPSASCPPLDHSIQETSARTRKRQKVAHGRAGMTHRRLNYAPHSAGRLSRSPERPLTAGMPSPPTSHGLSATESDAGSNCVKASEASFQEWLLHDDALKCAAMDGVDTDQQPGPGHEKELSKYATFSQWPSEDIQVHLSNVDGDCRVHIELKLPGRVEIPNLVRGDNIVRNPAGRASSRRARFTSKEDKFLRQLKEECTSLSWNEIHEQFNNKYPGRSQAALQVRYCTKLKSR